jgi:hypothetical protein
MSSTEQAEELCHCGEPLHYTDEVVEAFTKDLVKNLGPTVKVNVGTRTWEVQRHFIALHGLRAADLPTLGFPEVEVPPDSPLGTARYLRDDEGLSLGPSEAIEAAPGPLEGDESDEALMEHQAVLEGYSARTEASAETRAMEAKAMQDIFGGSQANAARFNSPMRSVMDSGAMRLSDALQAAKASKGAIRGLPEEQAAHNDLLEAIAEFMLGN